LWQACYYILFSDKVRTLVLKQASFFLQMGKHGRRGVEDDGHPFRPHHGAPQGGPSAAQLVAGKPSAGLPAAGRAIRRSTFSLPQRGQHSGSARFADTSVSKEWVQSGQEYS
jgi:hypothetical protein